MSFEVILFVLFLLYLFLLRKLFKETISNAEVFSLSEALRSHPWLILIFCCQRQQKIREKNNIYTQKK